MLKSDHYGIEIRFCSKGLIHQPLLKSDHYGIEIKDYGIYILAVGGALKSDHYGIEIICVTFNKFMNMLVKIRPLWD